MSPPCIWNPVPLVQGSTRWYVLVRTSTSSSRYEAAREKAKLYIPVQTWLYWPMTFLWQYIQVCTGMYCTIKRGTRRYNQVQRGTQWYKEQYKEVQDSMYWYVLECTCMYFSVQGGTPKYKEIHVGTTNSTRRYVLVCTGMYLYVLYGSTRLCCPAAEFAAAILPGR